MDSDHTMRLFWLPDKNMLCRWMRKIFMVPMKDSFHVWDLQLGLKPSNYFCEIKSAYSCSNKIKASFVCMLQNNIKWSIMNHNYVQLQCHTCKIYRKWTNTLQGKINSTWPLPRKPWLKEIVTRVLTDTRSAILPVWCRFIENGGVQRGWCGAPQVRLQQPSLEKIFTKLKVLTAMAGHL